MIFGCLFGCIVIFVHSLLQTYSTREWLSHIPIYGKQVETNQSFNCLSSQFVLVLLWLWLQFCHHLCFLTSLLSKQNSDHISLLISQVITVNDSVLQACTNPTLHELIHIPSLTVSSFFQVEKGINLRLIVQKNIICSCYSKGFTSPCQKSAFDFWCNCFHLHCLLMTHNKMCSSKEHY